MVRVYDPIYRYMGFNIQGDFGPWTFYKSRRGKLVFYPAMPALEPASPAQLVQQSVFRNAARTWRDIGKPQRQAWERASKKASLSMTGFSLWVWWTATQDRGKIDTLARQTGEVLLP